MEYDTAKGYPTRIDGWLTIGGMAAVLLGLAGVLFLIGHARGTAPRETTDLGIVSFGVMGVGLAMSNYSIYRYLTQILKLNLARPMVLLGTLSYGARWRGTFGVNNLRLNARSVGSQHPDMVVMGLYSLVLVDVLAFVIGRLT